jgi:hypothetical protein
LLTDRYVATQYALAIVVPLMLVAK